MPTNKRMDIGLAAEIGSIPHKRKANAAVLLFTLSVFMLLLAPTALAQCVAHPEHKTAVRFANETGYDLTFFVDGDETGIPVPSKTTSPDQPIEPGEHIFRARAIVAERSVRVWTINEVPRGHICTWTVTTRESISK